MKKVLSIVLIIFLLIFGYGFKSFSVGAVNDELDGLVEDSGEPGLWHVLEANGEEFRAYVHMRYYYSWTPGITLETKKNDDDILIHKKKHSITITNEAPRFDSPDPLSLSVDYRDISAPGGFSRFVIEVNTSENHEFQTVFNEEVESVRVILNWDEELDSFGVNFSYFSIYDQSNRLLFFCKTNEPKNFRMYWVSDFEPDFPVIDVGQDYSLLPDSDKEFLNIKSVSRVVENIYSFSFIKGVTEYKFLVNVPLEIDISKFLKNDGTYNISYSTDNGKRFLYLQPDLQKPPAPVTQGTILDPADYSIGFVTINLTDMTYDIVKSFQFKTVLQVNDIYVSAYLLFPIELEKVYSVRFEYEYRYKYMFFFNGEWIKEDKLYLWDEKFNPRVPWWLDYTGVVNLLLKNVEVMTILEPVPYNQIPERYRILYEESGIYDPDFDIKVGCKVQVGNFDKFGSTKVEFKSFATTEITYLYEGIVYKVDIEDIDEDVVLPAIKGFFDFKGFFAFKNVNDLASFFDHLVKYWKESIVVFGFCYLIFKGLRNLFVRRKYKYRYRW